MWLAFNKNFVSKAFVDFGFFGGEAAEVNVDFSNQNGMIYSNPAMV